MGIITIFVVFSLTMLVVLAYTFRKAPILPYRSDLYPEEHEIDSVETKLPLSQQITLLTDRRLIQSSKQLPLSWCFSWLFWWKSWQDRATVIDLKELDSTMIRRGPSLTLLFIAFLSALVVVDLGLLALLAVLLLRLVVLEFRSRTTKISCTDFAWRSEPLGRFFASVQSRARADKDPEVGVSDHAGSEWKIDEGQFKLGKLEVGALSLAILSPLMERLVAGSVSVDSKFWSIPLIAAPIFVGGRRGVAAGVVVGLLCSGGILGGYTPYLPVESALPMGQWLAATFGLVCAGLIAGGTRRLGIGFGLLGGLGYCLLLAPRWDLMSTEVGWACLLFGSAIGTFGLWIAALTTNLLELKPLEPPAIGNSQDVPQPTTSGFQPTGSTQMGPTPG